MQDENIRILGYLLQTHTPGMITFIRLPSKFANFGFVDMHFIAKQIGNVASRLIYKRNSRKVDKKSVIRNRYSRIPHPALNTKRDRDTHNQDGTKIKTATDDHKAILNTLGKSSNRSPENFNILAKISNVQKIPIFQRKYIILSVLSKIHFDRSLFSVFIAIKRWVPLLCKIAPNHTILRA